MRSLYVLVLVAACSGTGGSADFVVSGAINGTAPMASSRVAVLWRVTANPSYQYKFGDGTASRLEFVLSFDGDPPPAAINDSGLAIGEVVMYSADAQIPDGVYAGGTPLTGITMDYALIFKEVTAPGLGTWDRTFGARYSCAKCVRSTTPHGYELTGCAQMALAIGGAATCQWY